MRRLSLPVCFVLLALSGCLPDRNNRSDPANAPNASLQLLDESVDANGTCGGPPFEVFAPIERGHCLVLDASKTVDPQGDLDHFDFAFSLDGEAPWTPLAVATTSSFVLTDLQKRELLPPFVEITFRVTAVDARGSRGEAKITRILSNDTPIAKAGAPVLLPLGGYEWDSSITAFDVVLDGSASFDPDGDPLQYCWNLEPPGTATCSSNSTISLSLPIGAPARVRATLTVRDGRADLPFPQTLQSTPSITTVSVEAPPIWFESASEAEIFERIAPIEQITSFPDTPIAQPFGVAEIAVAYHSGTQTWVTRAPRAAAASPTASTGIGDDAYIGLTLQVDAIGDRVWAYYVGRDGPSICGGSTATRVPTIVSFEGPLLTPTRCVRPAWTGTSPTGTLTIDAAGNLWAGSAFGSELDRIGPTPAEDAVITGPGQRVLGGIGARPGVDEVWLVRSQNFLGSGTGLPGPANLIRMNSGANTIGTEIELPTDTAAAIAWITKDSFWLATLDAGVFLLDARVLSLGRPFAEAVITSFPGVSGGFVLYPDTIAGGVWTMDFNADNAAHLSPTGEYTNLGSGFDYVPQFVDENGDVWMSNSGLLARGGTPTFTGVAADAQAPVSPAVAVDSMDGGLWTFGFLDGKLRHIGSDGSVVKSASRAVTPGGGEVPIPLLSGMSLAPGTHSLWAQSVAFNSTAKQIVRIDTTAFPPTLTTVLDTMQASTLRSNLLIASAPIPATTPFAWIAKDNAGANVVSTLTTDGTIAARFSIPSNEFFAAAVLQTRTNRLCLATVENDIIGMSSFRLRSISPAGSVTLLAQVDVPYTTSSLNTVAASINPDLCWMAISDGGSPETSAITAWRIAASLPAYRSASESGFVRSILARSADDVWVVVDGSGAGPEPDGNKIRLHSWSNGTGAFTKRDALDVTRTGNFLCPSCTGLPN